MRDDASTYLKISDFLNNSNYKPQRTEVFSPQQVFGLLDKMNKRIKRLVKKMPLPGEISIE